MQLNRARKSMRALSLSPRTETQCTRIAQHYRFLAIGSSTVLREEVLTGTQRAVILARMMSEGRSVPSNVLVELIEARMLKGLAARTRGFLVCGFPRDKDQCKVFDEKVRPPDLVLHLSVRDSLLMDRILGRTVTSTERQERDFDEIRRRIKSAGRRNKPVLRRYKRRLVVIDGERDEAEVFQDICEAIDNALRSPPNVSQR